MTQNGPLEINPDSCISCGQCVAVCPNSAIDNVKSPLSDEVPIRDFPVIDSKTAEQFLRSRRSIRCYKDKSVPQKKLLELVNIARFAPTAGNSQGISYIIVQDKKILEKTTEIIIEWMEKQLKGKCHWSFPLHVRCYRENGIDTILRNAPHLILGTAKKEFRNGRENTISSFSYVELFATALGLGSCWAGLFEMCAFSNYSPLIDLFNVPENKVITGALMVGYPEYTFKRLADRNPLSVTFID